MKASPAQINIIEHIQSQLEFYKTSNDITSPTHHCDNADICDMLEFDNKLTKCQAVELEDILDNLYFFILNIKS